MHALRTIERPTDLTSARPSSDSVSLTRPSGISPQDGMACLLLMKQTKDRYLKQQIPEGTAEMYLAEWEEMAMRFGLDPFRDALSTVIRDRARPPFFPEPHEIEAQCMAAVRERLGRRALADHEAMKAQWERERAEDLANGIARGVSLQAERDELLRAPVPVRHTEAEIAAYKAVHVPPEEVERCRERMRAFAEGIVAEARATPAEVQT